MMVADGQVDVEGTVKELRRRVDEIDGETGGRGVLVSREGGFRRCRDRDQGRVG